MKSLGREAARDLLLLSLTAGSADAVGYLGLGQVFTSNMTGNMVLLGIDLGQDHLASAGRALYVLAIFMLGLCLGAWLGKNLPEKQWSALAFRLIGLEKIALLVFGIGWFFITSKSHGAPAYGFLTLLALAMGLQSAAMYRLSAPGVGTTAITGTLTAFATGLMNLLFMTKIEINQRESNLQRVRFQLVVIFLYACGAALGGFLIMHVPRMAGSLPLLAAFFVTFNPPKD
jgi:uncharacterized membrane protein YoaK (UPF0700 family)